MPVESVGNQHEVDTHVVVDAASDGLALTRTLSGGVNATESIAYQENIPEETSPEIVKPKLRKRSISWLPVKYLILMCSILTSLSFGVTQVPLLYVFRLMTCDGYYESHSDPSHENGWTSAITSFMLPLNLIQPMPSFSLRPLEIDGDRCSLKSIESSTAVSVALLGASTTLFGIANLFLTGSLIKRIGVQRTLIIQIFFPAIRLLIQNIGVEVWGYTGILIVQCSQVVSIIGGPSGYILALNQFITEVVSHEERTAALGRLAGTGLFGSGFGFLLGGILAEEFGMKIPFRVTLMLFLSSAAFAALFLPYVPPASTPSTRNTASNLHATPINETVKRDARSKNKFFAPLLVFKPRKFVLKNGQVRTEYGAFLLAIGVFLGILATGYLPTMLQLYGTDVFGFATEENAWLIFMYSMLRGIFLTFAFPELIALGRRYVARRDARAKTVVDSLNGSQRTSEQQPLLANQRAETEAINNEQTSASKKVYTFDLTYTRFSIVADGVLTLLCTFLQQGWQMYLMAALLPFAGGTGSAAKGTVLQIVGATASSNERTDALAGISLIENMARLTTASLFGVIFAAFTTIGRPELVFTVNAACALVAFTVLLFARFPPEDSVRVDIIDKTAEEDDPH